MFQGTRGTRDGQARRISYCMERIYVAVPTGTLFEYDLFKPRMTIIHLPYTHSCFVCGADNAHGLRLRFRVVGNEVQADFVPRTEHAGYKGMVHGGVLGAALDEVMFWAAAYVTRQFQVSVELNIRYARKVEVGQAFLLVGKLEREQRRMCFTSGEVRNTAGDVCASATGKFYPMRPQDVPLGAEDFYPDPQTIPIDEFLPKRNGPATDQ